MYPTLDPGYRLSLHREVVATARGVLDGSIGIVEGARLLARISFELGADDDEPFVSFQDIDSETDDYPTGDARSRWNTASLAREDAKRARYEAEIREAVEEDCRTLIARYKELPSNNAVEQTRGK